MTRTAARWRKLVAQAHERDGHRCRLEQSGCTGAAITVAILPAPRPVEPDSWEVGTTITAGAERPGLDRLVSACPACAERQHPEPDELADELADLAAEPLTVWLVDTETGEVRADSHRLTVTRGALARAQAERDRPPH